MFLGSGGQKWAWPFSLGTLKSAVLMKWADLLQTDTNLGKLNLNSIRGLIDHGTLKSRVSHKWFTKKKKKWFDELSRVSERFLHVDSDEIIFGLTTNLHCIFDI